jgi:RNA polymerase sigma-70 factor (ECF subfamily)
MGVMETGSEILPRGAYADDRASGRAFDAWYRTTWPLAVKATTAVSGRSSEAADAAGEAFVRAFERWGRPDWPDNPTGWVLVVAMNLARRPRARALVHRRVEWTTDEPATFELPDRDLWAAVRRLPRRQCEAIALRYAADLTEREVAEAMGISVGAASATLTAARDRLRRELTEPEPHP